ncbi:MAG TPA: Gfo/Idh/MocA family oxidoreductase [Burkholderiales bacterium]
MTPKVMAVGCGTVFDQYYQPALKKLESRGMVQVVALVDPGPGRTAGIQKHFPSAGAFATPAEAFAVTTPDLTIIASPPNWHAEHAIAAFRAGSHVLCEKPMAASVEDAERMVAAARAAKRVLAVGMTRRMYPSLAEARALLDSGALGDDLSFVYREGGVYGWPVSTDFAFRRATAGGGVLMDKGSHVLDFLAALFGRPTAAAYADDGHAEGVETNCRIGVEFPGARGTVQLSWSQPLVNGFQVCGSAGQMTLHPWRLDAVRLRKNGGAWETRVSAATWPSDLRLKGKRATPWTYEDCVYYQIVQSLRAVVHGEQVPVTGEDGLAIVHAIDACYRQATPLRLEWLSEAEQAQADSHHWSRQP